MVFYTPCHMIMIHFKKKGTYFIHIFSFLTFLHWKWKEAHHQKVNGPCFFSPLTYWINKYVLHFLYGDLTLHSRHFCFQSYAELLTSLCLFCLNLKAQMCWLFGWSFNRRWHATEKVLSSELEMPIETTDGLLQTIVELLSTRCTYLWAGNYSQT